MSERRHGIPPGRRPALQGGSLVPKRDCHFMEAAHDPSGQSAARRRHGAAVQYSTHCPNSAAIKSAISCGASAFSKPSGISDRPELDSSLSSARNRVSSRPSVASPPWLPVMRCPVHGGA